MEELLEQEVQRLEAHFLSGDDPMGRGFVSLADVYRRAGVFDRARELLTEGLAVHPSFSSGHLVSGWVHREQGEVEAALSDFRKVLDLDPTNVSALRGVGELEEERRNHGPALESFRLLAEIEQRDVELAERVSTLTTLLADEAAAAVEDEPPVAEEGVTVEFLEEEVEDEPPVAEEGVTVEFLEEEVEVEPEAVAIGSLAPDGAEALVAEPEAVAIGSLAPDGAEALVAEPEAVAIGSLAPDVVETEPLAAEALAPEVEEAETIVDEASPDALIIEAFGAAAEAFEMGEDALRAAMGRSHTEQKEPDTSVTVDEPEAVAIGSLAPDGAEALVDEPEAVAIGSLAPDGAEPEPSEEVVTRTMAGIYARQGMYDRAIEVVDQLIEDEPGDESLTSQREELVRAASGGPAGKVIPEASPAADVQVEEGNARDIVPIESLAPAQPDTLT